VDFDGVIMRRDGSRKPIKGARSGVDRLRRQGYEVVIHSTRALSKAGENEIRRWLTSENIPFDDVTARKVDADAYLDDKAVRFEGWMARPVPHNPTLREAWDAAMAEQMGKDSD